MWKDPLTCRLASTPISAIIYIEWTPQPPYPPQFWQSQPTHMQNAVSWPKATMRIFPLADSYPRNSVPTFTQSQAPTQSERLALFQAYQDAWQSAVSGKTYDPQYQWIFAPLQKTKAELNLPDSLFTDLLSAFAQDIVQRRYETFSDVLDYCRRSANPIGRLVLLIHGERSAELAQLSDQVCTGLQLANFWQDISVDLGKDRIYLPLFDLKRLGVSEEDLFSGRSTPNFRNCLRYQCERTWTFFRQGEPLSNRLPRPLSWEIRLTWLGGTEILNKIQSQSYDTLNRRPKVSKFDFLRLGLQAFFGG